MFEIIKKIVEVGFQIRYAFLSIYSPGSGEREQGGGSGRGREEI
jgi:hypothetical protein